MSALFLGIPFCWNRRLEPWSRVLSPLPIYPTQRLALLNSRTHGPNSPHPATLSGGT